jgi:hypothetical protein
MGCCGKAGRLARGAAGLAKAGLGIDRAAADVITMRRDICRTCSKATLRPYKDGTEGLTTLSRCTGCHDGKLPCFIGAKTKVLSETCPLGKWETA